MSYIYLDNAATVKPFDSVVDSVVKTEREFFYNSGAAYAYSLGINEQIESARGFVAQTIGANPAELFFTGGATEANNWAIAKGIRSKKGLVISTQTEHDSIHTTLATLSSENKVIELGFDKDGKPDLQELERVVTADTTFVSLIHVCGQTGIMTDVAKAVKIIRAKAPNAIIHSDGVQAWCRTDFDVKDLDVDLYTMSGHKVGGMKGVGILYVRNGTNLAPFHVGGNQENQKRGGTRNNSPIISLPIAYKAYSAIPRAEFKKMQDTLIQKIKGPNTLIVPSDIPQIFTACFAGQKAQVLQSKLYDKGVLVGTGAACSIHDKQNRILKARGVKPEYLDGTLRLSIGPHNTVQEMEKAGELIKQVASEK